MLTTSLKRFTIGLFGTCLAATTFLGITVGFFGSSVRRLALITVAATVFGGVTVFRTSVLAFSVLCGVTGLIGRAKPSTGR